MKLATLVGGCSSVRPAHTLTLTLTTLQTLTSAIAAMHAVANSLDLVPVADGGMLNNFVKSTGKASKSSCHRDLYL